MKYVKYKNNRFCKIIIFIFVVIFGFSVLVFKSDNKVKAGVIIDETATWTKLSSGNTWNNYSEIDSKFQIGISYARLDVRYGWNVCSIPYYDGTSNRQMDLNVDDITFIYPARLYVEYRPYHNGSIQSTTTISCGIEYATINQDTYLALQFKQIVDSIENDLQQVGGYIRYPIVVPGSANFSWSPLQKSSVATISSVENIYDMPHESVAILYLSDISGLNTTDYTDEITINWGYIDDNDPQMFSVYAPKITAFHDTEEEEIGVGVPQNAGGSATTYQVMKHNTLLSLYDSTYQATANIYAVYIHLTENTISWGFVSFNCTSDPPTPTAQSMQYITNSVQVYSFTASNSTQMTCRLSVSSNFNYITILNQSTFNIGYINPILRSGGFFPAWACYNWARGQTTGYATGYNAGQLPYQVGGTGYNEIWNDGYAKGQEDSIDTSFLVSLFDSVDSLFSIHLFPFLTIGEIVGIPFVISVVWFIIKQLRGGGGAD